MGPICIHLVAIAVGATLHSTTSRTGMMVPLKLVAVVVHSLQIEK